MIDNTLAKIRSKIPVKIFTFFQPTYHLALSFLAAVRYGFPSCKIKIIGITGTKGKSSTVEILNAIMEEAGYKTALSNTIRFKVGHISSENLFKMSMPGRFVIQKLLHKAVTNGCQYFIMEMTSQGSLLNRHKFIDLDAFVFTNLSPEHIEAHGSYEKYAQSKVNICKTLKHSQKKDTVIIVNADDKESYRFTECTADRKLTYGLKDVDPFTVKKDGLEFTLGSQKVQSKLSGEFNLYNILAAITAARSQNVSDEICIHAVEKFTGIPGRVQKIEAGQDFSVIVDYAHTADS
ncbi:MAG: Mur ligase family protein, partial [bacterium]|nr:Mur ligase family protein [bacterium]